MNPIKGASARTGITKALVLSFVLAPVVGFAQSDLDAHSDWAFKTVSMPPEALTLGPEALAELRSLPRIPLLEQITNSYQAREDWRALAEQHLIRVDGDRLLLEIRLAPDQQRVDSASLTRETGLRVHAQNVPTLFDAWVPVRSIQVLLDNPAVATMQPAREVQTWRRPIPRAGSVTSEGVAASGMPPYHELDADGEGAIIALIDAGFNGWEARQATGDWPPNTRLRRFVVSGSTVTECTGSGDPTVCATFTQNGTHGTSTMEIAYDMAPGATYWVYKSLLVSEWYRAIDHATDASNHGGQRADIISASLGAPLDGVGDGSACPPVNPSNCGSIAEISEIARDRGTLVVNSSGNSRLEHWGGLYLPSATTSIHDWSGSGQQVNYIGSGNGAAFCIPDGFPLIADLYWDDWQNWPTHDYDMRMFEWTGSGWSPVTGSFFDQNGGVGQRPQERIAVSANSNQGGTCGGTGAGIYGFVIDRFNAPTNRNLQFFGPFDMDQRVEERSLGFPADSPAVFSVSAINASGSFNQQSSFSSEGPVLAPGGGLPPPANVDKPDGVSFSGVSTVTPPGSFAGTSSSAPHVAGVAAVLAQLRQAKPTTTNPNPAVALHQGLALVGLDGDNDLGASGHDTVFGYGRIRLRECSESINITAETWYQVALPCERLAGNTIAETFGTLGLGTYFTDWRMWRLDPMTGGYTVLSDENEVLNIAESYWLYSFNPGSGTLGGLVADVTEAWPVDTTGAPAFGRPYMVSNPRRFSIPWNQMRFFYDGTEQNFSTAVSDNRVRNIMWTWDAGTQSFAAFDGSLDEGSLDPGEAFWIRVTDDVQVRFPISVNGVDLPSSTPRQPGTRDDWVVELFLESADTLSTVRIGHHHEALDGFDRFDAERLSSPGSPAVRMGIPQPEWGDFSAYYMRDIRSPKARDFWRIEINATEPTTALLHLDDPHQRLAASYLIDETTGARIPIREFSRSGHRLNLEVGTRILHLAYVEPR